MAFCLWPNQAAAVAGGYGGGRVESPSGGNPSNGFSPSGDGSRSYVHHNETGNSNTTPLEGLISTVFFVLFGGAMIWQRRRRNQPVDEDAFQEMWAALPGTSKEKKALLKEIQQTFLEIQQAWDQENLSVVKDNYTEKLYQKHLAVLQENQQAGIRNHVKKVKVAPASNYHHISETSFSLIFLVLTTRKILKAVVFYRDTSIKNNIFHNFGILITIHLLENGKETSFNLKDSAKKRLGFKSQALFYSSMRFTSCIFLFNT